MNINYKLMMMERYDNEQMLKNMILDKCDKNLLDSFEFAFTESEILALKISEPKIYKTKCDCCNKELLCIWDNFNSDCWFPYFGCQAKRINTYNFSPIINCMRNFYKRNKMDWKDNNLINSHTKIHTNRYDNLDFYFRSHPDSFMILCNDCFRKTYNRILVQDNFDKNLQYAITILNNENPQDILNYFKIDGTIIGTGSIKNY